MSSSGNALKNIYTSGWAATGAKGVLASTMMDAYAVADTIMSDLLPRGEEAHISPSPLPEVISEKDDNVLPNLDPHPEAPPPEVEAALMEGLVTEYNDWKAVDAEEVRRGEKLGKERERMGWDETRAFLAQSRTPMSQSQIEANWEL